MHGRRIAAVLDAIGRTRVRRAAYCARPRAARWAASALHGAGVAGAGSVEDIESAGSIAFARQRSGKAMHRSALLGEVGKACALLAEMPCPGRSKRGARFTRDGVASGGRLTGDQLGLRDMAIQLPVPPHRSRSARPSPCTARRPGCAHRPAPSAAPVFAPANH